MASPCETGAHFHDVNQFQLFFGGNAGWYQRHPLAPLTVHYTDAFSTYGPFGSIDDETFRFFTLRPMRSELAGFMPEDRSLLARRGKRNYSVEVTLGAELPSRASERRMLIERETDGLFAELISLGPGAVVDAPPQDTRCAGRYYCVVQGSIDQGGTNCGVDSLGWADAADPPPTLSAGRSGCDLLVLQFPA
jgi:hypothetical protein